MSEVRGLQDNSSFNIAPLAASSTQQAGKTGIASKLSDFASKIGNFCLSLLGIKGKDTTTPQTAVVTAHRNSFSASNGETLGMQNPGSLKQTPTLQTSTGSIHKAAPQAKQENLAEMDTEAIKSHITVLERDLTFMQNTPGKLSAQITLTNKTINDYKAELASRSETAPAPQTTAKAETPQSTETKTKFQQNLRNLLDRIQTSQGEGFTIDQLKACKEKLNALLTNPNSNDRLGKMEHELETMTRLGATQAEIKGAIKTIDSKLDQKVSEQKAGAARASAVENHNSNIQTIQDIKEFISVGFSTRKDGAPGRGVLLYLDNLKPGQVQSAQGQAIGFLKELGKMQVGKDISLQEFNELKGQLEGAVRGANDWLEVHPNSDLNK